MPARQRRGEIVAHADVFDLDLHRALIEQLPEALDRLALAPLTRERLEALGSERGVYQLFEHRRPVYVGKSETTLADRLDKHRRRCSGRLNIDINQMTFRCIYVDRFVDAVSPERILIDIYRERGDAPWNGREGFAPRDVGRNRDRGVPGRWFLDHPANYETFVTVQDGGHPMPLMDALVKIREAVPFDLFRFASARSADEKDREDALRDYPGRYVTMLAGAVPILAHVHAIMKQLPAGWQATVLSQGIILYKESFSYDYAFDGWRRTEDGVEPLPRGSRIVNTPS